jgi:hypothetical protein
MDANPRSAYLLIACGAQIAYSCHLIMIKLNNVLSHFFAVLCLAGSSTFGATLMENATVQVSNNHSDFNLSVFPGKATFSDGGQDGNLDEGTFGDGTVLDYRFFDSPGDALNSYADGGAGRVSNATAAPGNVNGNGEHWAVVWTSNDPGSNFSGGSAANFPSPTLTFARAQNITGTIDISGLESGSLYFPHGTFINSWSLDLVMSGAGQANVIADAGAVNGPGVNMAWITDFSFEDATAYDTITYTYTNTDSDGSRARFMGVIIDGSIVATDPPTVINAGATDIQPTTASLGGEVTVTGGVNPSVTLYWGDNDGGTTPGNWDAAIPFGAQGGNFSTGVSGLTPATTYSFRCFASNSAGDDWANDTATFSTGAPPDPPIVINTAANGVTFSTAELNGTVTATGGETPNVTIYFGDDDGGTVPGSWDDSVAIGAQSGAFSNSLFALTHDTTYYFRAFAQNSGGSTWAPSTTNFTTAAYSLPAVINSPGSNITGTAAQVGGEVTATGGDASMATIYWGASDGGTNVVSWGDSVTLGIQNAEFSSTLSGLSPLTTYYFRARVQNAAGEAWAASTVSFTTLEVSELIINEFMAANDGGNTGNPNGWYPIANQIPGTRYDWIEILNTGTNPLDLGGWRLTNDAGDLNQWTFPPGTVLTNDTYLIVYASSANAPDANGNLHTNFKLSAGGEYVGLVRPSGTVASAFGPGGSNYPNQSNDVSYGLHPNTSESVYFSSPTPGAANDPNGLARVADTRFSPDRGYYQSVTNVTIATDTPGATIYYTTDGMPPVDSNGNPAPTASAYTAAIPISQTTNLRAAAVKTGFAPTNIDTHSYILLDIDGANADGSDAAGLNTPFLQQTQPAGWGNLSSGDFNMDTNVTKSTAIATGHATTTAQTMLHGMRDIPTISVAMNRNDFSGGSGIYSNSGSDLERACSAEYIPSIGDTRKDWQINCGIKVQGGASRNSGSSPKHSLNFRFRAEYGSGKLRQPLFPGSQVEEFNSIAFRAGYNNSWIHRDSGQRGRGSMIRDQWMRESMLDMGDPAAGHGFMVHIFINGLYWGVHNICERPESSHYAAHNGGDEDILDSNNGGATVDGNSTAFNAMKALVADTGAVDYWAKVQSVIDIDHYIDYQIINRYGGNADLKGGGNWRSAGGGPFPAGQPEQMAPWQLYSWDGERTLESQSSTSSPIDPFGVRGILENNTEYKIRFADRLQKHFFNGGSLTPNACTARWMKYANDLDRAIIAESARWGDHRRNPPYTRDGEWLTEQNRLVNTYFPVRSSNVFSGYNSLFPNSDAPVFQVNGSPQHGGEIPGGGTLTLTATSGTIYYTLDGSDPRLEGGAIDTASTVAITTGSTVTLPASGPVRVRALNGGEWSALDEATFYVEALAVPGDLAITEIHYNPYPADVFEQATGAALPVPRVFNNRDDFEFIELRNISGHAINLDGSSFTAGISHLFGVLTLPADGYVVLVKDAEAFGARHAPVVPAGTYLGNLDDSGEQLILLSATGNTLLNLAYDNAGQWPGRPDGNGSSLELINSSGNDNEPANWRPSSEFNGSPGSAGAGADRRIVINEVLSHSDLPAQDAIELYNTTGAAIDISGWILSDDNAVYPSFSIPTTNLAAGGYVTFDEDAFNPATTNAIAGYAGTIAAAPTTVNVPGHGLTTGNTITIAGYGGVSAFNGTFEVTATDTNHLTINTPFLDNHETPGAWATGRPFALSATRGEDVWLLETDPSGRPVQFVDRIDFAAAFNGETLGRWPNGDGTGTLVPMSTNTLGSTNLGTRIGPVIISEVMYHPDAATEDPLEFVEIYNTGPVVENLAEWRLRGGGDFSFTASHSLAARGGLLVVVAFDPLTETTKADAFRTAYGIDASIPLAGPFTDGPLGNQTGTVRLQRPDTPPVSDPAFYPQVTEDEVIYLNAAPWPLGPDGNGESLNRAGLGLFGNFPSSWNGASPTPGGKRLDYATWSQLYMGPGNPPGSGMLDDFDLDDLVNMVEYALGLNPLINNPSPVLVPEVEGNTFTASYPKNTLLIDASFQAQISFNLEDWDPAPDELISTTNYLQLRKASGPIDANQRFYLRLLFTLP